jgi:cytochrome b561
MAVLVILTIIIAFYMDDLPKEEKLQFVLLHRSLGLLILQLAIVRIIWVLLHAAPAMPKNIPQLAVKTGKIVQHTFYLLLFALPLTGFILTVTAGKTVGFFGLFELPLLLEKNEDIHELFEDIHVYLGWLMTALVVLHIAAGIYHRYKDDGVFDRMWFTKKKVDFLTAKLTKD